jgi:AcrR family transcriptional regulator
MPKTDGYKTKERILGVAEQLFAEKGFNGTSIDKIATSAGVNKGLIYYHFKDKKDIIVSIFEGIIREIDQLVRLTVAEEDGATDDQKLQQKIKTEIEYCKQRKRIISVMLMESLKADGNADFLFKCAEIVIQQERDGIEKKLSQATEADPDTRMRYLVSEFFTGFIPIVFFVTLQEKWCDYFGCEKAKALDYFMEAFTQSHLKGHRPEAE